MQIAALETHRFKRWRDFKRKFFDENVDIIKLFGFQLCTYIIIIENYDFYGYFLHNIAPIK